MTTTVEITVNDQYMNIDVDIDDERVKDLMYDSLTLIDIYDQCPSESEKEELLEYLRELMPKSIASKYIT